MNKQEAKQKLHNIAFATMNTRPDDLKLADVMQVIDQIDETSKVVVPRFVAEWIEEIKETTDNLSWIWSVYPADHKTKKWLEQNTETFMSAWLDGYEVEQDKLYTVEIPDPNSYCDYRYLSRNDNGICLDASNDTKWKQKKRNQFTESEIKEDFEWAWNAGFAKEVK
ncbi:TPA: DUF1642 domain-containing protein [Streptococcus suis]|nr:DUF1642 domain-containing protein [Streptococcus suis]